MTIPTETVLLLLHYGNRFEFRAVGSSANCSTSMIVLNAAVAYQLTQFKKDVDAIIKKGETRMKLFSRS